MLRTLSLVVFIAIVFTNGIEGFRRSTNNLQRLSPTPKSKGVGLDLCPWCIDEAVGAINVILNVILDEGILGTCADICGAVANKTGSVIAGDLCSAVCDGLGVDEFIHEIIKVDLDPIWYCQIARFCPIKDDGDGKFTNFGVLPTTGPQGTTFIIDCTYKTMNGTGTGMLRVEVTDAKNETSGNDYLIEERKPGTYPERIGLETLTAMNCDSSKGLCDPFPVGTYSVKAQLCNGECDSQHPHSQLYDVGKATFTVTKKK